MYENQQQNVSLIFRYMLFLGSGFLWAFLTGSHVPAHVTGQHEYMESGMENTNVMMTSSNGNIFRITGPLCGEFTGHRWIPLTEASDEELWFFFYLCLNKRLSKQSWGWWFATPSCSLWHRCNVMEILEEWSSLGWQSSCHPLQIRIINESSKKSMSYTGISVKI